MSSIKGPDISFSGDALADILSAVDASQPEGRVATYIPALARVPADRFGIAVSEVQGGISGAGDRDEPFSIQSISKLFTLTLVMRTMADELWNRVGREPSGDPFNSLVQLEHERGVPRNPLINAGALVLADCLITSYPDPKNRLLDLVSSLAGESVTFDREVAASEAASGHRNQALAHLMKSFGNIHNDVDEVLDLYYHQCSIPMSCDQLARAFGYLANQGSDPREGSEILSPMQTRRVNALMLTCGTYDAAGEFAFRVGIPCKSGVGGGIVGVVPGRLAVTVWSPALDPTGNSVAGMAAIERLVARAQLSVF